jgi:hypothetical protein
VALGDRSQLAERGVSLRRVDQMLAVLDRTHPDADHDDAAIDAFIQLGGNEARPLDGQAADFL